MEITIKAIDHIGYSFQAADRSLRRLSALLARNKDHKKMRHFRKYTRMYKNGGKK